MTEKVYFPPEELASCLIGQTETLMLLARASLKNGNIQAAVRTLTTASNWLSRDLENVRERAKELNIKL